MTTQLLLNIIDRITKTLPPVQLCVLQDGIWGQCDERSHFTDLEAALVPFLRLNLNSGGNVSVEIPDKLWTSDSESDRGSNSESDSDSDSESHSDSDSDSNIKSDDTSANTVVMTNGEKLGDIKANGATDDHASVLQMLVREITQGAPRAYVDYLQMLCEIHNHHLLDDLP